MRLIDADALKKPLKDLIKDEWLGLTEAGAVESMLDNAPTIDAVEVVRCRDCKHRPFVPEGETYENGFSIVSDEICPCVCDDGWYSWIPPDNHYCSYGERIE